MDAKLLADLKLALRWQYDPDDPLGTFEDIADWFRRETGYMRPGKSEPMECSYGEDREREREKAWNDWRMEKNRWVRGVLQRVIEASDPASKDLGAGI